MGQTTFTPQQSFPGVDLTHKQLNVIFSQVDDGSVTGTPQNNSPETDDDYRLRTANDVILDIENFNYAAQNTGKHTYLNTTMTAAWAATGLRTNSGSITTTTTGLTIGSYAEFPILNTGFTYFETEASISAQPQANVTVDFGLFRRGASTPYAPTDGIYFRIAPTKMQGVINYNGTETTVDLPFTYTNNTKYQFIITINTRNTEFWINNVLYGSIPVPDGQGTICLSNTLPFSVRQAHVGAAGAALSVTFNAMSVSAGGPLIINSLGEMGNRALGSYQGLSGGTMGGLTAYTNSTNPTAAVPSNTALTANLPSGLGGQAWETATLAVNTDGILMSYQVPAGTVAVPGKRLKIRGVKLTSFIQTVIAGGPLNRTFALAFGHTAVSLATTETASSKKPRIILLPELTQTITANQAVSTVVSQPFGGIAYFEEPIYVNPGEFVALTVKHIGTVGTSGTIATNIQYDYSWE